MQSERRYKGLPVSGGAARARVCLFREEEHTRAPVYEITPEDARREKQRLERAMAVVSERLDALRKVVAHRVGRPEAEIFAAQKAILQDDALGRDLHQAIDAGANAEAAVLEVIDAYESRLQEVDSDYIKERATDLGELKRRLLDVMMDLNPSLLCAGTEHCQRGKDRVIVADELTPAISLGIDTDRVLGIVTERGGPTSHAAILARALGIPAVTGIPGIRAAVTCGTELLVNGDTGEVVAWPTEETAAAMARALEPRARVAIPEPVEGLAVYANISLAAETKDALAHRAEGIGLYRTEFEFFAAGKLLDEDEQADRYAAVVRGMEGRPVAFRLLDIGGDKPSPLFDTPKEANPMLGRRGARFLESRPELLAVQARALARASRAGTVRIMYPMVVDLEQYRALRRLVDEAVADTERGELLHGPMFEVPSACLEAEALLAEADFASIGSNDLLQYLFAIDRNNDGAAGRDLSDHAVFWRLLETLVRAADAARVPLAVCGEMAAEPRHARRLVEMGIRTVSVSARHIPVVRRAVTESPAERNTP